VPDLARNDEKFRMALESRGLAEAELRTAEAATPGHPLVNNTDQWVGTALRRTLRQAADEGADAISIPSGDTVLGYGMGGEVDGMRYAYDKMYPSKLAKILKKLDPSIEPEKVGPLKSHDGAKSVGKGFTVFNLTPEAKKKIKEGLPLFGLAGVVGAGGMEEDDD
jgi:hypothetical protein